MLSVLIQNALMAWSIDAEDAIMLLDIPSKMNKVQNDQLAFILIDICLNDTLYR